MELRINKDTVTHIEIYDVRKGIQQTGNVRNDSYELLPYKKERIKYFIPFFNKTIIYPKGYYRNGIYELSEYSSYHYTEKKIENMKGIFVFGLDVFTKPFVKIYVGNTLIKSMYFDFIDEAQSFCNKKFPNVNVIFND